jgi:uncharacterized FlaG/YvyC family protein
MQINPIPAATTLMSLTNHTAAKLDNDTLASAKSNPNLNMSPAQINRTYEISKDPPVTVLKYTNTTTKEVELQIPSATSLQIYKETQRFMAQQAERENKVNIIV